MGKTWLKREWARHLVVAAGYLLAFMALRPLSTPYWGIMFAFQLSCLLFLPYRYWLTLPWVDMVGQSLNVLPHLGFGLSWVIISMIPGICAPMPIVWWCREKLDLFPTRQQTNFHVLLLCTSLSALASAAKVMAAVMHSFLSPGLPYPVSWITLPVVFMGKYTAVLFVLPWLLMARAEIISTKPWKLRLLALAKDLVAADTLLLVLSAVLLLLWFHLRDYDEARQFSYLAMYLPIAWATLKPGWRATALGGTPAILCIVSLMQWHGVTTTYMLDSETFIALVMTCMFILGARVTARQQQEDNDRLAAERAIALARQNIHFSELRLKKTAEAMELAGGAMTLAHHQILARFRHLLAPGEIQRYFRQASATQNQVSRLAESMHPSVWRERGLQAALRETIAGALTEIGIPYRCNMENFDASGLSADTHIATYRLACETIAYVNAQMVCSSVRLRLRSGVAGQARWIALRVDGTVEPATINDAVYDIGERQFLASKLGAHGLDLEGLHNHAELFGGRLRQRTGATGIRIACLLVDEPAERAVGRTRVHPWIA
jgi:two-component system, NarL family, sensor histidine kinase FusK